MGQLKVTITIPDAAVENALISALEGGSNYWYRNFDTKVMANYPKSMIEHGFELRDGETGRDYVISPDGVRAGLQIMAERHARHFANLVTERGDATTGDVLLQCIVLGEVIYG